MAESRGAAEVPATRSSGVLQRSVGRFTFVTARNGHLVREDDREASERERRRQMDSTDLGRERVRPNNPTCFVASYLWHVYTYVARRRREAWRPTEITSSRIRKRSVGLGRSALVRHIRILVSRGSGDVRLDGDTYRSVISVGGSSRS